METKKTRKHIIIAIVTFMAAVSFITFDKPVRSKAAAQGPISNGTYRIASALNNDYVMDVEGASYKDGANVQLYKNNFSNAQKFIFKYNSDGYYTITNVNSSRVLDCEGAGTKKGTNIQQYKSNSSDAQRWKVTSAGNGTYTLTCKCNGLVADVNGANAADGTNIQMYTSNGTAAQKWKIISTSPIANGMYKIVSGLNSNYVMDIDGASKQDYGNLQLYKNNETNAQKFNFKRQSDGYYIITNVNSGKALDCEGAGTKNGTNILQYTSNSSDAQKWKVTSVGNGYYTLTCKCNGLLADVNSAKVANGTNIHMYSSNGTKAQKWKFVLTAKTPEKKQVQNAASSAVTAKLDSLINKYNGKTGTGAQMYMGIQCKGFANWVLVQLFGKYIGRYPNDANYKLENPNAQTIGIIAPGGLNINTAKTLLQKGVPGDYIQVRRNKGTPHSMILREVKSTGIVVFDCNSDRKNTIKKYEITWSSFSSANCAMSLYHMV